MVLTVVFPELPVTAINLPDDNSRLFFANFFKNVIVFLTLINFKFFLFFEKQRNN